MRIYTTDEFDRFMKKARLTDEMLRKSALELANGLHDGDLDMGTLFKKRIASGNQSKRDSNRSIIAVAQGERLFFIDGWRKSDIPKSGKEIPDKLMEAYRLLGASFRSLTTMQLLENIQIGLLREVSNEG